MQKKRIILLFILLAPFYCCKKENLSFKITSPTSSDKLYLESECEIFWEAENDGVAQIILYYDYWQKIKVLVEDFDYVAGENKLSWHLNDTLPTGKEYLLLIQDVENTDIYNYSEKFSIYSNIFELNEYYGIPDNKLDTVLIEEFDSNENSWWEESNTEIQTYISNGNYVLHNLHDGYVWFVDNTLTNLQNLTNFQLEMKIRSSEPEKYWTGIIWGFSDWDSPYFFYFLNDSYTKTGYNQEDDEIWDEKQIVDPFFNPTGYNLLTIRKYANEYYFFLNEKFISSSQFIDFQGTRAGVFLADEGYIYIDYISLFSILPE